MADGSTHSNLFTVGSIIEVRPKDTEFKDTFFSGTVISQVSCSKVTVKYHNRFKDEDGSTPVTEEIDVECLRPSPAPDEIVKGFEPGDVVEAFYKGDWWIGSVSKVVKGEERRYLVKFQNPPKLLEFALSDIRVHWDWVNGDWVRPHKKAGTRFMFNVGSEVEVSPPHKSAWYSGMIEYLGNGTYFLVKCGGANTDEPTRTEMVSSVNVRPYPPLLKNKNFVVMENVDAFFDYGWWSGIITQKIADNRYVVFIKQLDKEREFDCLYLRSHMDLKDGKWIASYQKSRQPEIVEFSEKRKIGKPQKSPAETIQKVTDYLNKKDDDPRIVPAALARDMETSPLPNQVKTLNKDIVDMETLPLPIQVETLNKDIAPSGGSVIKYRKRTRTKKREVMVVEESINPQDNHIPKEGREHNTFLRVQDRIGASGGKSVEVNPPLEVNIVCDAPSHNFENEPLLMWDEGKHIPAVDISEPSPVSAVEQPMENGEKNQGDIAVLEEFSEKSEGSIPMMDKHPVVPMGPQSLPFVKKNILWKTLEAMDPFQRIPQNPHFQPLQHIKESLREGEAIGYMVTFAGVVERIYGLQFGDPKSVTDDILEALVELESNGFNVKPIKDRMSELLMVKEKGGILVGDLKEINGRILEHRQQKDKVDEEIEGIMKEIRKMEQKLSVLESAKEKEEGETAAAVHSLMKAEERIEDVKREWESIVYSTF